MTRPEEVKAFLEANGWRHDVVCAVFRHGDVLAIQEVDTRSKPDVVLRYAKLLVAGLEVEASAREKEDAKLAILKEHGGEYNGRGLWIRVIGDFGAKVRIIEQHAGGTLYIRWYDPDLARLGKSGWVTRTLRTKDKALAIRQGEDKYELLRKEEGRRRPA